MLVNNGSSNALAEDGKRILRERAAISLASKDEAATAALTTTMLFGLCLGRSIYPQADQQ